MKNKRLAFLFPGQGSQVAGMGRDLAENSSVIAHLFREANETLDLPITRLMFEGPEEELKQTQHAQPALFLIECAITRLLEEAGIRPVVVAGHSIGEYAALVTAGVIDYGHGLWLVKQRGDLMRTAGEKAPGGMVAVLGLDDEAAAEACAKSGGTVVVANYNSPGQVVISGESAALERAVELCKAAGAKRTVPLAVSGAFHSPLLADAAARLAESMDKTLFRDAQIPVITNVDGQSHLAGEPIKKNLRLQMESGVRWTQTMKTIADLGLDGIIEVGPGSVLSGLAKRTVAGVPAYQAGTWDQVQQLIAG